MELGSERTTGLSAARLERIGEHLERSYIEPGKIAGCQVAVTRHGHPAYFRSLGEMDREAGRPMADDAIFRIYSMTKPITSVALMTLYERGLFQLDDPVGRFFPEWRKQRVWVSGSGPEMVTEAPARPVTVRDMLRHTGGLTYGNALAGLLGLGADPHPVSLAYDDAGVRTSRQSPDEFMAALAEVPLMYQPGERWMYSLSTDVCGALVERISGRPFDRFLREEIFEPLGMADTAFTVPADRAGRLTACYRRAADKTLRLVDAPGTSRYLREPTFLSGGGGLVSTTADYLRFCEMLRRGGELDGARILGPRTLALMHRNHLKGGGDLAGLALGAFSETGNEGVGFGLGFAVTLDAVAGGGICEGDYYWGGAASTIFWVDPVEDLTVVFMTQLLPSNTFDFRGQLRNIVYSSIVD